MLAAPALAGDRALFDAIGYSSDGRYFAFEEYGVQDGSGFAYSNIYVLDVPADRWVPGAPFSARLEDDGAPLSTVRDQALALAAGTLDDLGITGPVDLLALNGDGEPGDGQTLAYGLAGFGLEAARDVATLTLEMFPATGPTDCAEYTDQPTVGFALNRDGVELHRDASLPKSRGCALGYKLYAVVAPALFDPPQPAMLAIVSVYPLGFEGPDRRFIAVPIGN
jgi:hypothetical protein